MMIEAKAAFWFLPFVLPLCWHVAYTDLREMRISNRSVLLLAGVFLLIGPVVLPLADYGQGLVQMAAILAIGFALNAARAVGAGDAKFAAAAAGFIAPGDLRFLLALLAAMLLAGVATHRLARSTGLRDMAPGWTSWERKRTFPMGLSLGGTLALYLILGALLGQ